MAEEKKEKAIGYLMMGALLTFAIVIDLLQAVMDVLSEPLFAIILGLAGGTTGAIIAGVLTGGLATAVGAAIGGAGGIVFGFLFGLVFSAVFSLFLDVIALCVLGLWFHLLSKSSEQKINFGGKLAVATFIEIIPFANMLPGWTIAVAWTIYIANGGSLMSLAQTALNFIPIGRVANVGLKAAAASGVGKAVAQGAAARSAGTAASSRGGFGASGQTLARQASTMPYRQQIDGLQRRPTQDSKQTDDRELGAVPQTA